MIRFFKELYLTGFVIFYRIPSKKNIDYRLGAALGVVAFVQSFILMGVACGIEIFIGGKLPELSRQEFLIIPLMIFFVNMYFISYRRYGIEFDKKFDKLDKSRKRLLIIGSIVFILVAIAFGVCMGIAYGHFLNIHTN